MSKQRAKGTAFENAVADYLAQESGLFVVRRAMGGTNDKGDLLVKGERGSVAIECKNCQRHELADWLRQARVEAKNAGDDFGVVVFHARGKGAKQMGDQFVLMGLAEFKRLIGGVADA